MISMSPIVNTLRATTISRKSAIVTAVIVFETADHGPPVEQPRIAIHGHSSLPVTDVANGRFFVTHLR
jgi:hypothetical protein